MGVTEAPLELNRYLLTLKYNETFLRTIHSGTFSSGDSYIHLLTTLFQSVLPVSAFQPAGDKFSKPPYVKGTGRFHGEGPV